MGSAVEDIYQSRGNGGMHEKMTAASAVRPYPILSVTILLIHLVVPSNYLKLILHTEEREKSLPTVDNLEEERPSRTTVESPKKEERMGAPILPKAKALYKCTVSRSFYR